LRQAEQDIAAARVPAATRHARFADLFSPAYMASPILIGVLLSLGSVTAVWFLLAAVLAAAGPISQWLAQETRGRNLELVSPVSGNHLFRA
jgi:hypothetical protein